MTFSPRSWLGPWESIPGAFWMCSEISSNSLGRRRFWLVYFGIKMTWWLLYVLVKESNCLLREWQDFPDETRLSVHHVFTCSHHLSEADIIGKKLTSVMTLASCHWLHGGRMQSVIYGGKPPSFLCLSSTWVSNMHSWKERGLGGQPQELSAAAVSVSEPGGIAFPVPTCLQCRETRPLAWVPEAWVLVNGVVLGFGDQ